MTFHAHLTFLVHRKFGVSGTFHFLNTEQIMQGIIYAARNHDTHTLVTFLQLAICII